MKKMILILIFALQIGCSIKSGPELHSLTPEKLGSEIGKLSKDKALLINVWATWCSPCIEEFPHIVALRNKYQDDINVMFISADFTSDTMRVKEFLKKQKVDWITYIKSGSESEFIEALHPSWSGALPFTLVLSRDGNEVKYWENKAESDIFDFYINEAIKRGKP